MITKEKPRTIALELKDVRLPGTLTIPENATGVVLFSHGSGSGMLSPRNCYVSEVLQQHGLATLLFDLLTEEEYLKYEHRFDIGLLTSRLIEATKWVLENPETLDFPIGYFGSSTGAASALIAAAHLGIQVHAVVSRGGRPDLSMNYLHKVKAATLLIVGANDYPVMLLNRKAFNALACKKEFEIVADATHLFEEPGKLDTVAHLAAAWFKKHLK